MARTRSSTGSMPHSRKQNTDNCTYQAYLAAATCARRGYEEGGESATGAGAKTTQKGLGDGDGIWKEGVRVSG